MSLKQQIAGAKDRPSLPVTVEEWPDAEGKPLKLKILSISAKARETWEQANLELAEVEGKTKVIAVKRDRETRLLVHCLADESEALIFADTEEDLEILRGKSGIVIDRLAALALAHNKLRPADAKEAEKNLLSALKGASTGT